MRDASIVEYIRRTGEHGWLWLDFKVDGHPVSSFGPYFSEVSRQYFLNETLNMLRVNGAKDVSPQSASTH